MDFSERFLAARRVSTPIVAVATNDQPAAIKTLVDLMNKNTPLIEWDLVRGMRALNNPGIAALSEVLMKMGSDGEPADSKATTMPQDCLVACDMLPGISLIENPEPKPKAADAKLANGKEWTAQISVPGSVVFLHNAHNYVTGEDVRRSDGTIGVAQALCILRDSNKANGRMTVLLGPEFSFPPELRPDVYLLDEPLPTPEQIRNILDQSIESWNNKKSIKIDKKEPAIEPIPEDIMALSVNALRGIESGYAAAQIAAMSLSAKGYDREELWERKRQLINATPGLKVYRGKDTFADVEGYDVAKDYFRKVLKGRRPVRTIVFIDEGDKMFGNSSYDTSGTNTEMLGMTLTEMQDMGYTGSIFLGPAGSGKTAMAKAIGGESGEPFIYQDMAGAKQGLVGASTANLRRHFKIIRAVSDGAALFIMTCNKIAALPPELKARFGLGTFFFDLPTPEERVKIWALHMRNFELQTQPMPKDNRWVGRDIWRCCELAWSLNIPILEASNFIVPMAIAAKEQVEDLRRKSGGKYLSASYPGLYKYPEEGPEKKTPVNAGGERAFAEEEN